MSDGAAASAANAAAGRPLARPRHVAILLFDDVEVLDFAGPFEVFSVAGRRNGRDLFDVYTVASAGSPVLARNQLSVNPRYSLDDCPRPDLLLVPGGVGTRRLLQNERLLAWLRAVAADAEFVLSVCTGALLLGKAGLLDGLAATTHHSVYDLLEEVAPHTRVERGRRFVDNGRVIVSAGVSAGIDMSLHVVARLHGAACAAEAAHYMEYDWRPPVGGPDAPRP